MNENFGEHDDNYREVLKPNMKAGMAGQAFGSGLLGLIIGGGLAIFTSIFALALVPVIFVLGVVFGYFSLKAREYRFGDDYLEWYEGFININKSNIAFNRVTDVSMSQPVVQRFFGTGTIKVNTAGSNGHEVKISYVDNPEQTYDRVRQITGN